MTAPVRIANCSGFYGDRLAAAREMVDGGPIDVLTGDWLAELTMLILAKNMQRDPAAGYARTFVTQLEQVMGDCLSRGIKVVSNAGGLSPRGCADAVAALAGRLGLDPVIAHVDGDNLLPRLAGLRAAGLDLANIDTGERLGDRTVLTANAYLGGWGIAEALTRGADIVITGRVTDAALTVGPGGLAARLAAGRLGCPGRGRRGRPRDRVRRAGHRRQLRVLHRSARAGASWLPDRGSGGGRVQHHHQASRPWRDGVSGHGDRPAAL